MQFLYAPVHRQRSRIAWGGILAFILDRNRTVAGGCPGLRRLPGLFEIGRNRDAWSQALSFRGNEERGKNNPAEPLFVNC